MLINILEILVLFVLAPVLYYLGFIKAQTRRPVFFLICVAVVAIIFIEHTSLQDLGIRADNLQLALVPYLFFLSIGILALILYARIFKQVIRPYNSRTPMFLALLIPMSIGQELLFRGFLMPKLMLVFSSAWLIIIVNTFLFSLFHIVYEDLRIVLPLIFIAGIAFAGIYYFYPNLILISIVHMILNPAAVYLGFFRITDLEKFELREL